ncbi:MAG: HAD family phosphatase [Bacteroidetes bacterium]|nr:MAG: HAD family phosphatase [Bacteroidota bacterium]
MGLEAVIFDMDGTLIDSMPYHTKSWHQFFKQKGVDVSPQDLKEKGHGTLFDIMPRFFGSHISKDESYRLAMEKEAIYREMYAPAMAPIEGLIEWLDTLKANGLKIALGTAADFTNTNFVLDTLQIRKYFDVIVTSDIVPEGKPSPAVFNYAATQLGTNQSNCLVFEDTYIGVKAAKAAGMKVAVITTTHPHHEWEGFGVDLILDSYKEAKMGTIKNLFT